MHHDTVDPGVDLRYLKIPEQRSLGHSHLQIPTHPIHLTGTVARRAVHHRTLHPQIRRAFEAGLFLLLPTLGLDDR